MQRYKSSLPGALLLLLVVPAASGPGDGFLKTSRAGDLVVEFVDSEAGQCRIEFGLGTPDRLSALEKRQVALIQEGRDLVTPAVVNMGFFPAGSRLDFYMTSDYRGFFRAFSSNLATTPTASDLATFRDTDGSLGWNGSIIEKAGPDDWILHLDDPASVRYDDDDNDFVVRVRIVSHEAGGGQMYEHPGGLHSLKQLETVKERLEQGREPYRAAYEKLIEEAEAGLKRDPHAVETFYVPLYYQNPEGHVEASKGLNGDGLAAYACALAWQFTGKTAYADKARELLNAWATANERYGGQDGQGVDHDSTLVMAYAGVALVYAAELIIDHEGWTPAERAAFQGWLKKVFVPACLARTVNEKEGSNRTNWALLGLMAAYHFLDDGDSLDTLVGWLNLEIDKQIAADGHLPAETGRGYQGLWYTYFGLAPLTAASQIAWNATGVDLFHYTIRKEGKAVGLRTALDYYLHYCLHPEEWPWYKKSDLRKGGPDHWPGNLFEAMAAIYGDPAYEGYAKDSRPHVVKGHHYGWTFPTLMRPLPVAPEEK